MSKPDLAEFFKYSRPKRPPCKVGFASEQLPEEEAAQLAEAVKTDAGLITNSAIVQWLAIRKQDVNVSSVVSHRKGTCSCHE